jgi:hypothetical protein
MQAQRDSSGIVLFKIYALDGAGGQPHAPAVIAQKKSAGTHPLQENVWAPKPVCRGAEKYRYLATAGVQTPNR